MNTTHTTQKQTDSHTELAEAVRDLRSEVRALRAAQAQAQAGGGDAMGGDAIKSIKAIAQHLGIGIVTTHKLLQSGDIPARRIGDSWVASRTALSRWLVGLPPHPHMDMPDTDTDQDAPAKRPGPRRPGRPSKAEVIAARQRRQRGRGQGQGGAS